MGLRYNCISQFFSIALSEGLEAQSHRQCKKPPVHSSAVSYEADWWINVLKEAWARKLLSLRSTCWHVKPPFEKSTDCNPSIKSKFWRARALPRVHPGINGHCFLVSFPVSRKTPSCPWCMEGIWTSYLWQDVTNRGRRTKQQIWCVTEALSGAVQGGVHECITILRIFWTSLLLCCHFAFTK